MSQVSSWPVEIAPLGPVSVGTGLWRHRNKLWLTIVVKATFPFAPGGTMALGEPIEVRRTELQNGYSAMASLRASSDLSPFLRFADVLFVGHACPPNGKPATGIGVRLGIRRGSAVLLDKALEVTGNRMAQLGKPVPEPEPFSKMPLVYERAFGGIGHLENPLGTGLGVKRGRREALPNIMYPDAARAEVPAGFGPLSWFWPSRKRLLKGQSRKALEQPIAELHEDVDPDYFQAAPADQRLGFLLGEETIVLHHLNAAHPVLQMRLPGVRGAARVQTPWGAGAPLPLNADTLLIDGDAERCSLTFRGNYAIPHEEMVSSLGVVAGVELGGRALEWPSGPWRTAAARAPASLPPDDKPTQLLPTSGLLDPADIAAFLADSAPASGRPAPPGGNSFEQTKELSPAEASRPAPIAAPFRLAEAGDAAARSAAPIPGAPWAGPPSMGASASASRARTTEFATTTLALSPNEPARASAPPPPLPSVRPTEAPLSRPTEAAPPKPTEAPPSRPTEAPPSKPTEAPPSRPTEAPPSRPWSWVETAPPDHQSVSSGPPTRSTPPAKPAVKSTLYGAFSSKKK